MHRSSSTICFLDSDTWRSSRPCPAPALLTRHGNTRMLAKRPGFVWMHSIQAIYVLRRSQNRKRTVGASSWRMASGGSSMVPAGGARGSPDRGISSAAAGHSAAAGWRRPRSIVSSGSYGASGGGLQDCPAAGCPTRVGPAVRATPARAAGSRPPPPAAGRPCQLAVRRRAPPTSNSSASAIAPVTGRAGTGVSSATIENCTAAALGLPAPSCAAPAAMSTVRAPEAAGVIVAV